MQAQPLIAELASLLPVPVPRLDDICVQPCAGGGNNRVFTVTAGDRRYIAKCYFRHPSDTRDRLKSEFTFLNYAKRIGITCVPLPIACDNERGIGLYEYIDGQKLTPPDIDAARVDQAADFFLRLNQPVAHPYAAALPNASEACFSIAEHFAMVDARIARLDNVPAILAVDRDAREFTQLLGARWQQAKSQILRESQRCGIDPAATLEARCISPSDFGFHNALVSANRGLCFIDFEYSGWDDPAKTIGDFFSHPAVPVDMAHFERFLTAVTSHTATAQNKFAERARLLLPVFQTKWCCIILNDFLPMDAQRRRFADPGVDQEARKREQITKARRLYERVTVA
jgi:hypothetical protein